MIMEYVTPKVYHVASTEVDRDALYKYLEAVRAESFETDAGSSAELLSEVAGRLCYRSFLPGLNANVTKVREGNQVYLKSILDSKHGSVFEHASDTYILHNISRVLTHELVRHRAGCAYSQESLRYVRLDKLKCWYPEIFSAQDQAASRLREIWTKVFTVLEDAQIEMTDLLGLDQLPFNLKKKLTSAMRRLAPLGLATSIMITANHRAWRHLIAMRTSRHAEEEIRLAFGMVFKSQAAAYPNIYQDAKVESVDGFDEITFANEKI